MGRRPHALKMLHLINYPRTETKNSLMIHWQQEQKDNRNSRYSLYIHCRKHVQYCKQNTEQRIKTQHQCLTFLSKSVSLLFCAHQWPYWKDDRCTYSTQIVSKFANEMLSIPRFKLLLLGQYLYTMYLQIGCALFSLQKQSLTALVMLLGPLPVNNRCFVQ